jgi:hypothetical protein
MCPARCLTVVLVSGLFVIPAQAQVRLQWKLKEGDRFYLEGTSTTTQTLKIMGTPVEQKFESVVVDGYRVVKTAADQIVLEKKVESIRVKATGPGADEAAAALRKAKGSVFVLTWDPRTNTVTKLQGVAEFIKKAFGDNPALQQTMAATLNEDSLREEQQNILAGFLSDKPVKHGDKWTRKTTIPLGPLGGFSSDGEYQYQGKSRLENRELDRIDASWTLTYVPPKQKGGLPFEITKGDFKAPTARGTYYFDANAGKLAQAERKYNMKGTLTLSTLGQLVDMEMEMDQTSRIRLLDKAPVPE